MFFDFHLTLCGRFTLNKYFPTLFVVLNPFTQKQQSTTYDKHQTLLDRRMLDFPLHSFGVPLHNLQLLRRHSCVVFNLHRVVLRVRSTVIFNKRKRVRNLRFTVLPQSTQSFQRQTFPRQLLTPLTRFP